MKPPWRRNPDAAVGGPPRCRPSPHSPPGPPIQEHPAPSDKYHRAMGDVRPLGVNAPVAGTGTGHTTYRPDRGSTRHDRPADCRPIPARPGSRLVPVPVLRDLTVAGVVRC